MAAPTGPNGYPLCKRGHERTPENVDKKSSCKECKSIASKEWSIANPGKNSQRVIEWQRANPKKYSEKSKRWYSANPEKAASHVSNWRLANPGRSAEITKKWGIANPVKVAGYVKKWKAANREKVALTAKKWQLANLDACRRNNQNRRAQKKKVGGKLSKGLSGKLLILQRGKCRICKVKLDKFHLDHYIPIDKDGPNIDSNMQLLCPTCNLKKSAKDPYVYAQELGMLFL